MVRTYRTLSLVMVLLLVLLPVACGNKQSKPPAAAEKETQQESVRLATGQEAPPPERVPYEQAFPEDFKSIPPVRIGVLSSPNRPEAGQKFALMLSGVHRRRLERKLRKPIKIAFVSRSNKRHKPVTQIHYRPEFLHAAIQVAGLMPYKQNVAPMSEVELQRGEVDIFVYMGASAR